MNSKKNTFLIDYYKNIMTMEGKKYEYENILGGINRKIKELEKLTVGTERNYNREEKKSIENFPMDYSGLSSAWLGSCAPALVVSVVLCLFKSPSEWFSFFLGLWFVIGIIVSIFYLLGKYFEKIEREKKVKKEIEDENKKLKAEIIKYNMNLKINKSKGSVLLPPLQEEYNYLYECYEKLCVTLKRAYELDLIYPKYRNYIAVCTIYEYLDSGRCSKLDGSDGAYNLFESELRANIIINKLNTVVSKLDRIADNQHALYMSICNANYNINKMFSVLSKDLKHISESTEIMAYNTEAIEQNTEFIKWYEIVKDTIK